MTTLREIAQTVGIDVDTVRAILSESTGPKIVSKSLQDKVFGAARKMGYDFRKLKIGKRINLRREVLQDLLHQLETHPHWGRLEIIRYVQQSLNLLERVQKKAFREEFG